MALLVYQAYCKGFLLGLWSVVNERVTVHYEIRSELGICFDMGSFATELVTAGHKIENETELPSCSFQPNLAF